MMMKCGHAKNAIINGVPGCCFCSCTESDEAPPALETRMAKCSCGHTVPSDPSGKLAFFQFKGEGSKEASNTCKNCKYYKVAHDNNRVPCKSFEPHGAFEFDEFYCGCHGWE